jgi:hypothetical protein
MIIMRLHDYGIEPDEYDETTVPCRLDLTECKRTRPTDILKWAREKQRHLFPHLAPRGAVSNNKRKPAELPDDGVPDDLGVFSTKGTAKEIASTITSTPGMSASTVEAVARELFDWVKARKKAAKTA